MEAAVTSSPGGWKTSRVRRLVLVLLLGSVTAAIRVHSAGADPEPQEVEAHVTALSAKAARLETGLTKDEVLLVLGAPTWVLVPSDSSHDWPVEPHYSFELF